MKKVTEGISWEIWCSNLETGRFDEKLGDSRKNWKSWQVCIQSRLMFLPCYANRHINFPTDTKVDNIINSLHEEFIKI